MTESWKSKSRTGYLETAIQVLWTPSYGAETKKSADIAACCHYSSSVSFWAHTTDDTTPFIADNALTQDKHFNFQGNLNQLG